jgi:hypothetical protein
MGTNHRAVNEGFLEIGFLLSPLEEVFPYLLFTPTSEALKKYYSIFRIPGANSSIESPFYRSIERRLKKYDTPAHLPHKHVGVPTKGMEQRPLFICQKKSDHR